LDNEKMQVHNAVVRCRSRTHEQLRISRCRSRAQECGARVRCGNGVQELCTREGYRSRAPEPDTAVGKIR